MEFKRNLITFFMFFQIFINAGYIMKSILFLTILFYECNNQIYATLETLPSSIDSPSKTDINSDPISSIDIDYLKNGLVFQFRRSIRDENSDIETRRRSSLDKNFMRFGRSDKSMMRFGRSGASNLKTVSSRSENNLMRFGRNSNNRMRFGKRDNSNKNMMRLGRADNRMRLGRRSNDMMRFGRGGIEHLDSLERLSQQNQPQSQGKNLLIFGNLGKNQVELSKSNSRVKKKTFCSK